MRRIPIDELQTTLCDMLIEFLDEQARKDANCEAYKDEVAL
jgi:hypothetical protein